MTWPIGDDNMPAPGEDDDWEWPDDDDDWEDDLEELEDNEVEGK